MDRAQYNECMVPYMKGGGADRKLRFCTGAKLCSGKASTEEQARQICLAEPPKEKKPSKRRTKASCPAEMSALADCVITKVTREDFTRDRLSEALQMCACGTVKKRSRAEKVESELTPEQKEALSMIGQITSDYADTKWEDNFALGPGKVK